MTDTDLWQGGTTPLEPPAASRDQAPQISIADRPRYDCRNAYVETLAELAHENHRIVGVVNDSVGSSKLDAFKKAFPDRLINVGIAEQDMVGVAAGLANGGRIAFVSASSRARPTSDVTGAGRFPACRDPGTTTESDPSCPAVSTSRNT